MNGAVYTLRFSNGLSDDWTGLCTEDDVRDAFETECRNVAEEFWEDLFPTEPSDDELAVYAARKGATMLHNLYPQGGTMLIPDSDIRVTLVADHS